MANDAFGCLSCLVVFAGSSSGLTNIADQINARISKNPSFCRKTCPRQLSPLLFPSHNENETEIRFLRFNFDKELQADGKINRRTKLTIIRQTDKKDRHTDSPMIGIMTKREHWTKKKREKEGETDRKIVRKTPWNDVHIGLNNIRVNKPSHFMPFQKYRVWQVQLNDPTVFVHLAPLLVQLLSTKLHSSKSEKTFLRGQGNGWHQKITWASKHFSFISNGNLNHKINSTYTQACKSWIIGLRPSCVAAGISRGLHVEWLMDNVLPVRW